MWSIALAVCPNYGLLIWFAVSLAAAMLESWQLSIDSRTSCKHLADIYSTSFPPQVMMSTNGIAELMKNSIFYTTTLTSDTNLLILTGETQPANGESEYLLAQEILDIAAKFNTQKIFGSIYYWSFCRQAAYFWYSY
jgi:PAC2 family protein